MSRNNPEEFKKEFTGRKRSEIRTFVLAGLAILTTLIIALWNKLVDLQGIDITSLRVELLVTFIAFMGLLILYNRMQQ